MKARTARGFGRIAGAALSLAILLSSIAAGQVTQRVSVSTSGPQGNNESDLPSISADGRYVAFRSAASNLVSGDTNAVDDVFVRDRQTGTTERVSVDSGGVEGDAPSTAPSISADGRYVAFHSSASNLVTGDTNGFIDVFVRDRQTDQTDLVSVDSSGMQGSDESLWPSISADGRYVAFWSRANNLVAVDTNGFEDVFVRDRLLGTTERVSVRTNGVEGDYYSAYPTISADGRYVAFWSFASNLVSGDTNGRNDVFLRDLQLGTTERVSIDSGGMQGNDSSLMPSISADGRCVAFHSLASNLVAGDTNGEYDIFVRDRQVGTTERVSVDSGGAEGNAFCYNPSISADGRYVAFRSSASNLVLGDSNVAQDVFVRDRQSGTTERVSLDSGGAQGNGASGYPGNSISADGRYVAFQSWANNLVSGDTNGDGDIFVRDRTGGPDFTSLCEPGVGGVNACPCGNPPAGAGRGCDNSSTTGGAILSAAGGTYLSSDSLVFRTSGERPTALSVVLQGDAFVPAGLVYGQGVRCVGGSFKRLYTKSASSGSITAPDLSAGDLTVSSRSTALGDTILAGQSRWYLVFYRDPIVLGGCSASSTFNATQTGRVTWSP